MNIEIVNHCYKYHRLLAYQLSSFCLHKNNQNITYTLLSDPKDGQTQEVVHFFKEKLPDNIFLNPISMNLEELKNRGRGRHAAALKTKSDWIWFVDTDYVFKHSCFDDLAKQVENVKSDLVWPDPIYETDWATGDHLMSQMNSIGVLDVPESSFVYKKMKFAIGGVQILRGDNARKFGYVENSRDNFLTHNTRSDMALRRRVEHKESIFLNKAVRIRHEFKGDQLKEQGKTN